MKQQFTEREIEKETDRILGIYAKGGSNWAASWRDLALDSLRRKAQYRRRLEAIAYGPRGLARVEARRMLRRGFTLIDLLVVVAIIALLAALLFPVLTRAKDKAKLAYCIGNERQIAVAFRAYLDDYAKFPAYGIGARNTHAVYWDYRLLPYVADNKAVFNCPGHGENSETNWNLTFGGEFFPNKSYGYNAFGTGDPNTRISHGLHLIFGIAGPAFLPEQAVVSPSDMLTLQEIDTRLDDDGDGDPHPEMVYTLVLSGIWHNGEANGLFCDSHVEHRKVTPWKAVRERWNYDHEGHLDL